MKLTGAAKEAFDKWYKTLPDGSKYIPWFYSLTDSMKYGVYVDFFDSVGITVGIFTYTSYDPIYYRGYAGRKTCESKKSRHEARTAAIEKADELFNTENQ